MDEFDKIIEKYRLELMEFSKSNPSPTIKCDKDCKDNTAETTTQEEPETITVVAEEGESEETIEPVTEETAVIENNEAMQVIAPVAEAVHSAENAEYRAPQFENYEDFIKNNPQRGSLKVQVFAAGQAFPIVNAKVAVVLELKNGTREMFSGLTDINGIADNISLPAPDVDMSQQPSVTPALPYASYTTYVEHPDFVDEVFTNVPVFAGIKSIQGVELIPRVNLGTQPNRIEQNEGESFTRLKGVD